MRSVYKKNLDKLNKTFSKEEKDVKEKEEKAEKEKDIKIQKDIIKDNIDEL